MNVTLIHNFKPYKECTRLCGPVEITGITKLALIQILLKTVEDVLHTRIQLKLDVVVQYESIVQLQVEIEEVRGMLHAVFLDISGIMRHNHLARISAR